MKFDRHLLMVCVSEFIGTAILLCVGCASVVGITLQFYERNLTMIGIGFGMAVHISVHTLGTISGSHINPTVTLAAVVLGNMEWKLACFYVLSQFLGGLTGYALLFVSLTAYVRTESLCITKPAQGVTIWQSILIEFFLTSILVYFCCGVWDKRNPQVHDSLALRFGFLIAGLVFAAVSSRTIKLINIFEEIFVLIGTLYRRELELGTLLTSGHFYKYLDGILDISRCTCTRCRFSTASMEISTHSWFLQRGWW